MKTLKWLLPVLLIVIGWLSFAPTPADPVAWQAPPPPPEDTGTFARNQRLTELKRSPGTLGITGPEALCLDADGHLVTGLADGRIIRLAKDLGSFTELGRTIGRPLGMAFHPNGSLIIADGRLGLLALDPKTGQINTLATEADAVPIRFADDVAVTRDGAFAYFSDASTRWSFDQSTQAVIEHKGDGRLLRYNFQTGRTQTVLSGLQFANGVTLAPDDSFVLVNETGAYKVTRLWLSGDKAGQSDTFIDNLPGLPDNITSNGSDRYWLALFAPRNPLLDLLAPYPMLRKAALRATEILPRPVETRAMVIGLDSNGHVIANLQDDTRKAYAPITSVRELGETLYMGSLTQDAVASIPLKSALTTPRP